MQILVLGGRSAPYGFAANHRPKDLRVPHRFRRDRQDVTVNYDEVRALPGRNRADSVLQIHGRRGIAEAPSETDGR